MKTMTENERMTENESLFANNASIINIEDLPKIGDKHKYYNNLVVIEIKIKEFTNNYIIYQVRYCEKDSIELCDNDFFIDCPIWTYAIKIEDLNK